MTLNRLSWEYQHLRALCRRKAMTLKGHTDKILSVSYSPDGKRIVSGSVDMTVKVWDAASGQDQQQQDARIQGILQACASTPSITTPPTNWPACAPRSSKPWQQPRPDGRNHPGIDRLSSLKWRGDSNRCLSESPRA